MSAEEILKSLAADVSSILMRSTNSDSEKVIVQVAGGKDKPITEKKVSDALELNLRRMSQSAFPQGWKSASKATPFPKQAETTSTGNDCEDTDVTNTAGNVANNASAFDELADVEL